MPTSSFAHVLSIALLVNQKYRERVSAWNAFSEEIDVERFASFFRRLLSVAIEEEISVHIRTMVVVFLINCFGSLEKAMIRKECLRLTSLGMWQCLVEARRDAMLSDSPQLLKLWRHLEKQSDSASDDVKTDIQLQRTFLSSLIRHYFRILSSIDAASKGSDRGLTFYTVDLNLAVVKKSHLSFLERCLELFIDLLGQLPTRRYLNTLLDDHSLLVLSRRSSLCARPEAALFNKLLQMLGSCQSFVVHDQTGQATSRDDRIEHQSELVGNFQRVVFHEFSALNELSLATATRLQDRDFFFTQLRNLDDTQLTLLCERLLLRTRSLEGEPYSRDLQTEILFCHLESRPLESDRMMHEPLYPDERLLWDPLVSDTQAWTLQRALPVPKLNLQFLTLQDYLHRNGTLFRLGSAFNVARDIEQALLKLAPRQSYDGTTEFTGWSHMAVPVESFKLQKVAPSRLDDTAPAFVHAEVAFSLAHYNAAIRTEWKDLRQYDTMFLVTVKAPAKHADPSTTSELPHGIVAVRGCEMLDYVEHRRTDGDEQTLDAADEVTVSSARMKTCTVRVKLDPNQYVLDCAKGPSAAEQLYRTFNVLIRRKPKGNNTKPILEMIRELMVLPSESLVLPHWLVDVFLGYGDPNAAFYKAREDRLMTIDYIDTFVDATHLRHSFPDTKVTVSGGKHGPYRVTYSAEGQVHAESYVPTSRTSYETHYFGPRKTNTVAFTARQVEAITAAMNSGLSLIVGPPGSGKTDVVAQLISLLYHAHPEQRILVVTKTNQALNQLFEKILAKDIDDRHLMRLGHGEKSLARTQDFSRNGRVEAMLSRRIALLAEVDRLAKSLAIVGDYGSTCETARHFCTYYFQPMRTAFDLAVREATTAEQVKAAFPFHVFFGVAQEPLFGSSQINDKAEPAMTVALSAFRYLSSVFEQLEELFPLELLSTRTFSSTLLVYASNADLPIDHDRANYLLTCQTRIVAMTCTHASVKRKDLQALNFGFDTLIVEEAAQALEIETFAPIVLQKSSERLKRVVLIGDHHQLPPVVKNATFGKYGNLEQSMFARFVRLGVPTIELDAQGRSRPSLRELYSWSYDKLGDMPSVKEGTYHLANAGFKHECQFLDVGDYEGHGESEPVPFFYQNLGEAEYVVAVFQYMRLLGFVVCFCSESLEF